MRLSVRVSRTPDSEYLYIHGRSYTIDYDNAGRPYKLTSPGSVTGPVTDTKHYDDDGNVTSIVVVSNIGLLSDSMTYDNMGRVSTGHFSGSGVATNPTEDVTMMYHGLGSVIGMETNTSGSVATEAFTVDALGNRLNSWRLPMSSNAADPSTARVFDVSANGELMTVTSPKNDSTYATYPYFYRKELGYDGVGNLLTVFTKEQNAFGTGGETTMNYPMNYPMSYPVGALGMSWPVDLFNRATWGANPGGLVGTGNRPVRWIGFACQLPDHILESGYDGHDVTLRYIIS